MESWKERESGFPSSHKLQDSDFLKDSAREAATGRRNEKVKQKDKESERERGMKFGERLMQTYSFYYQSCLFVGSYTETTSWHFQLPNENNMFVWEKK